LIEWKKLSREDWTAKSGQNQRESGADSGLPACDQAKDEQDVLRASGRGRAANDTFEMPARRLSVKPALGTVVRSGVLDCRMTAGAVPWINASSSSMTVLPMAS
jgi:hypothetical protein